jgi:ribosomal protein L36
MKVRASVKKRAADCKIVKEMEGFMLLTKKIRNLNKDKVKLLNC